MIELTGGNDGLSTLVPYNDGDYERLRSTVALRVDDVIELGDGWGLHRGLGPLSRRLAIVEGVGTPAGDLSHFAMMQRWWRGDPDGKSTASTGFLGRCCDHLGIGQPLVGVTLGAAASPALLSEQASTAGLSTPEVSRALGGVQDPESVARRQAFERLAAPDTGDLGLVAVGRKGLREAIAVADLLGGLGERGERKYPGSVLGTNLALAGQLIGADVGVRVVHLPWGDFDTHEGQRGRHDGLMTDLGASVGAFLADLEARGRGGDVLVATTSEFGRRVKATATGTDHGGASVALLAGPVKAGRHGESPSLRTLDRNDNLVATTNMGEYLATLASWLGLDAADVIEGGPWRPLPGLVFS